MPSSTEQLVARGDNHPRPYAIKILNAGFAEALIIQLLDNSPNDDAVPPSSITTSNTPAMERIPYTPFDSTNNR